VQNKNIGGLFLDKDDVSFDPFIRVREQMGAKCYCYFADRAGGTIAHYG
jgi:hypothetical protein